MDPGDHGVRIDATGTLHALGRQASVSLRGRAGEWTLLPGPDEAILLRRADGRSIRLAGQIAFPGAIADIVAALAQGGTRGEMHVYCERGRRVLTMESGTIVAAATSIPEERLGELLFRFGVVSTRDDLNAIVTQAEQNGRRLGEVAIELGLATTEQVYAMMARQIEEVAYGALHTGDGCFYFLDGFDEQQLGRRFSVSVMALLMEGARRMDELKYFREKVPNAGLVPLRRDTIRPVPPELVAPLSHCDGERTIEEVGRLTGKLEFEITKEFYQLVSAGFVVLQAQRPKGPEAIVNAFNPALVLIHEQCKAAGKLAELVAGLERFATGGGVYDSLFMMAGPNADGSLRADRVARNIAAFAGGDQDLWLIQLMSDYVGFAQFQTESLLPRETERELARQVDDLLKCLRTP
jgi:Domain of unknown function (DUF4388)